jgi:membrane protease YdiL (CAAX protease family)
VKRFRLPLFFLLCLVISWPIWIAKAVAFLDSGKVVLTGGPLDALAVWAPGLAAILLSLLAGGRPGIGALLRPIRRWRVGIHWYLFVLLWPAALWFATLAIDTVLGRSYEPRFLPILDYFGPDQAVIMVPLALVFAFPNTLGEELGWRGFALPGLQAKLSALASSVILGAFWGLWHVPFWVGLGKTGMALLVPVVTMVGNAILYTWVYNSTGGSLLLAWLFHLSMTVTQYLLAATPTLTDDLLTWAVALVVILLTGPKHLSRRRDGVACS